MRISKVKERWFNIPNDPDKARIKIKCLLPGDLFKIHDKAFKSEMEYEAPKKGFREKKKKDKPVPKVISTTDSELLREGPIKKAVIAWENFFERDGKTVMECTPKNIERAINEIEGFTELVNEFIETLSEGIKDEKKAQEKN